MKKYELLAPAKDLHIAKMAIKYGADAVYIGGKSYSLRARASNFDLEDIRELVTYAHQRNCKIYVTVNMIFHDEDFTGIRAYLTDLYAIGVDAVIIASIGLLSLIKQWLPQLECHISTQLSSLNSKAILTLKDLGAARVVLAREASLNELQEIGQVSALPLEAFIHGGMCANYSGRCTISNELSERDANRGGCSQSCRWLYDLKVDDYIYSDYPFSMGSKDLNVINYLQQMCEANIYSYKIEGRMKSEYYIATVVRAYRACFDELEESGKLSEKTLNWAINELNMAENRPFGSGFLNGNINSEMQLYTEGEGAKHDYLAYVYGNEEEGLRIGVRNPFYLNQEVEVISPFKANRKFKLEKIVDEEGNLLQECKSPNKIVYVSCPYKLEEGDLLRR